ncbi:MAG: 3'-phosphoadenosine 5'-phosphosulfate sulfotransferase (PAPS reductase)/FAD synthetase [Chloroflexi bacterium]|nr:MAG: 3'-phosphoadenosine 5'-phosphosulfate sulfotransferase (PAPS reductase)/FAD synthetase [Chloroflexota bacterium]
MRHIVALSGGKDSTAMLLRMIELKMPIDEIRFFDTGWEFPQMYEHIEKLQRYIKREIQIIKPKIPFDKLLQKYGFPQIRGRWCTGRKINAINKSITPEDYLYIGYTYDEVKRMNRKVNKRGKEIYPLIEWKWTEEQCLQYCYAKGFDWGGLYEIFHRVSCWCCPFQPKRELYALYKYFPELWERLKEMQKIAKNSFRPDKTVFDLEEEFKRKRQLLLFTKEL